MLFWWLTIGFTVVWAIAIVVEVIWYSGPSEEEEYSADYTSEEGGIGTDIPHQQTEMASLSSPQDDYPMEMTKAGG
jgi:hypothetical protein